MQTITVTDARSVLPQILAALKSGGPEAVPILIARHRDPMAVLISVEQFHEYCAFISTRLAENGG
jgi:PHD/YefM family antitoxin component YafN of YafNO toxin-antitoxin module